MEQHKEEDEEEERGIMRRGCQRRRGEAKQGLWSKDIVNSEDGSDGEEH